MAPASSEKAARARRATTRPLAIRVLIFVGAASAGLTLGLTLFRPAPMERSGLIALEGEGNSTSLRIPIASGNVQAFPPSSAHRGDGQRGLPKKRSAISASQHLLPGEDFILQLKDINRSSEETGKGIGPPISKASIEGLTLKAFEKKHNDSAINGIASRDSETRNDDYPEDKVEAFTLWDEFPSNDPDGQTEAHYGGKLSFGLPALTIKPENHTGTYAANCSGNKSCTGPNVPQYALNTSALLTSVTVLSDDRSALNMATVSGLTTSPQDVRNASGFLTAVALLTVDAFAAHPTSTRVGRTATQSASGLERTQSSFTTDNFNSTNYGKGTKAQDEMNVFPPQLTLVMIPEARAGAADDTTNAETASASYEVTLSDTNTATEVTGSASVNAVSDQNETISASALATESSVGQLTDISKDSAQTDPLLTTSTDIPPDSISTSMLVTLTATETATDATTVSEFDSRNESALETSSPDMVSASMLVTMPDVDGIPSENVTNDATTSTVAGGGVHESSGDMASSAEVVTVGSSEAFAEEVSTDQSTTEMASHSVLVTVGSSQVFPEENSTDESTAKMASDYVPVTVGSSEAFAEENSTDESTAEMASHSVLVTVGSSQVFPEENSTDESTAEMASHSIPVTVGSSEVFAEEISTDQSTAKMASHSVPVTIGSSEVFVEEISSEQGSMEMASSSMPVTKGDQETVTEVISSETNPAATFSSTLLVTGAVSEIVTEVIDSEKTAGAVAMVIPVTSGYSEAVTEIIVPDESTPAGPVITAVDAITATDLIDFTEEVEAPSNWSTAQLPESSPGLESTAMLVTAGETNQPTEAIEERVTSSEVITAVELITFTEDLNGTTKEISSELESTAILVTAGETNQPTEAIEERVKSSEAITAVELITFTEDLNGMTKEISSELESTAILVTAGETNQPTEAIEERVTSSEVITAVELITFTEDLNGTRKHRVPITPLALVTIDEGSDTSSSESASPEASSLEYTMDTGSDVPSSPDTAMDTTTSESASTMASAAQSTGDGNSMLPTREVFCNTSFCEAEGRFLSGTLKGRAIDPCDNFHAYVCEDWSRASPDASAAYADAADALTGATEETAKRILSGAQQADLSPLWKVWASCNQGASATDAQLVEVLSILGVDLKDVQKASSEEALRAAGSVQFKLGVAPLAFVSLDSYMAKGYSKILALEEGDALMSPQEAASDARVSSTSDLACAYLQAVAPADQRGKDLCDSIANVAVQLAKVSLLDRPAQERMMNYSLETWDTVAMLQPLFQAMNGSRSYIGDNRPVLLKNQALLIVIKTLIKTMPEHVYRYVGFHATAYLSPFLQSKEALWELALYAAARQMPRRKLAMGRVLDKATLEAVVSRGPPSKWRLCLHVVDRLLPGILVVAFARATNDTAIFMELMADVIAEEVRSTFIDQVGSVTYLDNWTRQIFRWKARATNMYSLSPLRQFFHQAVIDYAKQMQTKLQNVNSSLDIFLKASAFVGSAWRDPKQSILEGQRYASTLFNPDCLHWPQHETILIPMGMFNHSIPTSPRERMFHVPTIGHRLAVCLFRETFPENFYKPFSVYWTRQTSEALKTKEDCFSNQYRANNYHAPYVFTRIGENAALRVAFEDFQQRLFTKRYLGKDYRFQHLNMTADQTFFIYYALSYCSDYSQDSTDRKTFVQDRVNVPLMNMHEFATAFNCAAGKPMNPSKRCHFWK
ncbi:platelet binding protein GspB-like isoform X2 [Dermacentor albipictus]|uniref:platelet binding protein GspB-like isoform X2 n=1 Tax=Dermacentor albipictus TaxID=60249 RepID=UPI0038FCDC35